MSPKELYILRATTALLLIFETNTLLSKLLLHSNSHPPSNFVSSNFEDNAPANASNAVEEEVPILSEEIPEILQKIPLNQSLITSAPGGNSVQNPFEKLNRNQIDNKEHLVIEPLVSEVQEDTVASIPFVATKSSPPSSLETGPNNPWYEYMVPERINAPCRWYRIGE